jgi:hypothetical protein
MQINCPNCNSSIEQNSEPVRGPSNDGSEAWLCLKCPTVICSTPITKNGELTQCYINHQATHHPELYEAKKPPTKGSKKNQRHKK